MTPKKTYNVENEELRTQFNLIELFDLKNIFYNFAREESFFDKFVINRKNGFLILLVNNKTEHSYQKIGKIMNYLKYT